MTYGGLGQYPREEPDRLAQAPGESYENWSRRTAVHRRHAEEVAEPAWTDHRARIDQPHGSGSGLFGRSTPEERAQLAGGTHGFSGDQRVEPNGHLSWEANRGQPGVRRVYAADLGDGAPSVSPLVAHMRGDIVEWH